MGGLEKRFYNPPLKFWINCINKFIQIVFLIVQIRTNSVLNVLQKKIAKTRCGGAGETYVSSPLKYFIFISLHTFLAFDPHPLNHDKCLLRYDYSLYGYRKTVVH